jgi:hypothetical protein
MAWGGNRGGFKGKKGNGATAGAFRTKTRGLYTAKFNGKWFKAALAVFKEASQQDEPGVVVFVRKNENSNGDNEPIFKIGLAVDKPYNKKRRIREDADDDPEMDTRGDSDPEDAGEREDVDFE